MILARGSRAFKLLCFLLLFPLYRAGRYIHRLVSSHSYDLSYPTIFRAQFQVYILTHDCLRYTADISGTFEHEAVILVPDSPSSRYCAALNNTQLHLSAQQAASKDDMIRTKYTQVLEHCADGQKMKCLIFEDDVVFLHTPQRTREILVENTLTLFNNEEDAFDCTKRGFGWFASTHTGNGSQCRIYSKPTVKCMTECLRNDEVAVMEHLDIGLAVCQARCELVQKRFLLVEHSGLKSTMERVSRDGELGRHTV